MFFQTLWLWLQCVYAYSGKTRIQPYASSQNHEIGQGLVEYAMILVFVGVLVMVLLLVLGPTVANMFTNIYESVAATQQ